MVGSPMAFVLTVVIVMTWVVYFADSDAWQLVKYRYDHCDFPHGVSEIVMARWSTRKTGMQGARKSLENLSD
jgi:hypothetical protein